MNLHISPSAGTPIYRQIVEQVKFLIAADRLRPDDELPPVRVLAQQLLINPNTVARAYRELETAGLVYKRRGAGTYVSDGNSPLARKERRRILAERADALLVEAGHLGFELNDVQALLRERHAKLYQPERKAEHGRG